MRNPSHRCEIKVRVTPRSSRNAVEGLKVRVTAAPTDGQANVAVCALVARTLGVPPSAVSVVRGHASRDKTLEVIGLDEEEALRRLGG